LLYLAVRANDVGMRQALSDGVGIKLVATEISTDELNTLVVAVLFPFMFI
jgi:hypothetical protein